MALAMRPDRIVMEEVRGGESLQTPPVQRAYIKRLSGTTGCPWRTLGSSQAQRDSTRFRLTASGPAQSEVEWLWLTHSRTAATPASPDSWFDAYHEALKPLGIGRLGNIDFSHSSTALGEQTIDFLRERHASNIEANRWTHLTRQLANKTRHDLRRACLIDRSVLGRRIDTHGERPI